MSVAERNSVSSSWLTNRLWKIMLAGDAELLTARFEHQPIRLSLVLDDVRMRGAEDDVHDVGVDGEDRRQRVDDMLDAFVAGQQAERQDHGLAVDAQPVLARGIDRHVRNPVRNEIDLIGGYAVDAHAAGPRPRRS